MVIRVRDKELLQGCTKIKKGTKPLVQIQSTSEFLNDEKSKKLTQKSWRTLCWVLSRMPSGSGA
jgi:hypothetical protein